LLSEAHTQSLEWANNFHGNESQAVASITTDADGNVYNAINFYNSLDADPGAGTSNLTSTGSNDIAIVKTNAGGDFLWAIQLGSSLYEGVKEIITDSEGSVYIIGYFKATLDFDPSAATYSVSCAGNEDGYFAKYDTDGNFLWVATFGSTGYEHSDGIGIDADDNIYLTGYFQNIVDFDPSATEYELTAIGSDATFYAKFDADGNLQWAKQTASLFLNDFTTDAAGNMYFTGGFFGTVDFDPGTGTTSLTAYAFGADAFVAKYDNDGNYMWVKQMEGTSDEFGQIIFYDAENDMIYHGGYFSGTVDFKPGSGTVNKTSAGFTDMYIEKFTGDGNYVWVQTLGNSTNNDYVYGLAIDATGDLLVSSDFYFTLDLDPGSGTASETSAGSSDIFFSTWDTAGIYLSHEVIGSTGQEHLNQLYIGSDGAIFLSGFFEYTVDFDPGTDTYELSAEWTGWNGFAAKYCNSYTINNFFSICEGDSIYAGGAWQTEAGEYYDSYDPVEGCDSTIITHIEVISPVLELGSDIETCTGETVLLDAANEGATYNWNTGDETQTIDVTESGTYSVLVSYASGCSVYDEITVTFYEIPVVELGADFSFCEEETIMLDAGNPGSMYSWSTGETTQTIFVSEAGEYAVLVTGAGGCVAFDFVTITVEANPIVELGDDFILCDGETAMLDAENTGADFLWNTGVSTQTIEIVEPGIYSVIVTDPLTGCNSNDEIEVIEGILPEVYITINHDDTVCLQESAFPLSGNPVGGTFSGGGITGNIFTPSAAGVGSHPVIYTFTDANGCTNADTVVFVVEVCNEMVNENLPEINIFPNPTTEFLTITSTETLPAQFFLFDMQGNVVYTVELGSKTTMIDISHHSAGVYLVKITSENWQVERKIEIVK
ncbi:MAG: T9SS type A sorting domain-containing protein, partial [Chitinophagales bacterium]